MVYTNKEECKRTYEEYSNDLLLLLYTIKKSNIYGYVDGLLKLNKLVFLSEWFQLKAKLNGFNYKMYKWDMGPYDDEINVDFDYLKENGIVNFEKNKITLTNLGEEVVDKFIKNINENVLDKINFVSRRFAKLNAFVLKKIVHNMKMNIKGKIVKIDNMPNNRTLFLFDELSNNINTRLPNEEVLEDFVFFIDKKQREELKD